MTAADWGLYLGIGGGLLGIGGGLLGIGGGLVGTWASLRATRGPRERAFMRRAVLLLWSLMLLLGVLAWLLPAAYRSLAFMPLWLGLPLFIIYGNRRQRACQEADRAAAE